MIIRRLARAVIATLVALVIAGPTGLLVANGGDIGGSVPGTGVSLISAVTFYGYLAALLPLTLTCMLMLALASCYPSLWAKLYWALAGSIAGLVLAVLLQPYLLLVPCTAAGAVCGLVYRLILGQPRPVLGAIQLPTR